MNAQTRRFRPLAHLGIRTRIVANFGLGALVIAGLVSFAAVTLSRSNLLDERERIVSDRAQINANLLADQASTLDADPRTLFGSLSVAGKPSVMLSDPTTGAHVPKSLDPRYGAETVPSLLRRRVADSDQPAAMRYERDGEPLLAVAVPLANGMGTYFEISQLSDIAKSLNSLSLTLVGVCAAATALGSFLGFWVSRRLLRPLTDISEIANEISAGRLDARLAYSEWAHDPALAPLVFSFNEMVAAMQARLDRDARFASDVSHELRSPLTTFNASLEVLENAHDEMPERAQIALDLLASDMERFTQLVEDLLEISRFDAGAVRLELDEVLLVESVKMAVRTLTADHTIEVTADDSLEGLIVRCDKRRLVRILANFLDNARKYGHGANRVTVERVIASGDDDRDPDSGDTVRVAVEDSGPGVPEADRQKIFDRFNRGHQGGSRGKDLGVGLGLALAAEHARLQGGSVWVEDRPDGETGARFVVELPLIEARDSAQEPTIDDDVLADPVAEETPGDAAGVIEHSSIELLTGEHSTITVHADHGAEATASEGTAS